MLFLRAQRRAARDFGGFELWLDGSPLVGPGGGPQPQKPRSWSADHGVLVESPKFGGNSDEPKKDVTPPFHLARAAQSWSLARACGHPRAGGWLGSCKGDREMAGSSPSLDEIGLLLQQQASLGEHPDSPVRTFSHRHIVRITNRPRRLRSRNPILPRIPVSSSLTHEGCVVV